jgi:glycosyltransferase involved in cell wall biosynthesis
MGMEPNANGLLWLVQLRSGSGSRRVRPIHVARVSPPMSQTELRILHVISGVDPQSGGPIEGILRQEQMTGGDNRLAVREIVTLDPKGAPFLHDFPIKVTALGQRASGKSPLSRFLNHYRYSSDLIPWLENNVGRFDFVIVHGLWNYAAWAAARVLPHAKVPYFAFTHGMLDPWFKQYYPFKNAVKQLFWLVSEGPLLSGAKAVLFTSEEERRLARGAFIGRSYREKVVGYGTAHPPKPTAEGLREVQALLPFVGREPFLLFLSRIHEKKGIDLLIEGFARVAAQRPDLKLVIAGPGDAGLVARLKQSALEHGLGDRIFWPGGVFGDAKPALVYAAEAFILTSHQENFGIAVAEALAAGRPVLISNKINIWREIDEARAGLIETDTVDGAEALLRRWLALSPIEREAMGVAAARLFSEKFDVAQNAPALLKGLAEDIGMDVRAWPKQPYVQTPAR